MKHVTLWLGRKHYEENFVVPCVVRGMIIEISKTTTLRVKEVVVQGNSDTIVLMCKKVKHP